MERINLLKKSSIQGFSQARAILYTLESLPLPVLHRLIVGEERELPADANQNHIIEQARRLLTVDAEDFVELGLPLQLLAPERPDVHFSRLLQILGDSTLTFWRRRQKVTQKFSSYAEDPESFPEYYRRNFHHQTDGYLSEKSAQFYEHQVELLFRGLADPMRRRLLKPMKKALEGKKNPKILELACGTGTFTRALAATFPEARITAIDLSPSYIGFAKERFIKTKPIDFLVGDAENLNFKANSFDAVVSVYLHHELPRPVRENVIDESLRVCKNNGFWGMVDSIQLGDDPKLDWAIIDFPKHFHEPFFTNYIKNPLMDYLKNTKGNRKFKEEPFLLSKVVHTK